MRFETSAPVVGKDFYNRERELAQLLRLADDVRQGAVRWWAFLGPRKVGKSSLLKEFMRHLGSDFILALVDCWEIRVEPQTLFLRWAASLINGYLIATGHAATTGVLGDDLFSESSERVLAAVDTLGLETLSAAVDIIEALKKGGPGQGHAMLLSRLVDLPERMSEETGKKCLVILDEFQELGNLHRFKKFSQAVGDIYALLRARWQNHRHVGYIISGSRFTLLSEAILAYHAPFFQHFRLIHVGPFERSLASQFLQELVKGASVKVLVEELATRIVDMVGGTPFYLQVLGEELVEREEGETITEDTWKLVLQDVVLSPSGRLGLYFQRLFDEAVADSFALQSLLIALAERDKSLDEIAHELRLSRRVTANHIKKLLATDMVTELKNTVSHIPDRYSVPDPCFRLWLRTLSPEGNVLPPLVVGDETEKLVARELAASGFRLVYQSRASRGTFDLLAIFDSHQIGLQCKTATLPFYLPREEYDLMRHRGEELGWIPILALNVAGKVWFYRLDDLEAVNRSYRVGVDTRPLGSLLELL